MTVRAIVASVTNGRVSARAVVDEALARIDAKNPSLNAFVDVDSDDARTQAEVVDQRIAAGERLSLAGVPVAVKDNLWVAGRRVSQGSRLFADFHPPADAIAVERLKRSGAIIVGMANTSEFASKGVTTNPLYGPTRHPMDSALTPGGSSGGPVVAVAAGMVPLAIGTDAGGSSRRPPAHVGIVGFKPSFGAIPYGPGFVEPFVGLSVIAPMAATVDDVAVAFEALTGPDQRDPDSIPVDPAADAPKSALKNLKIAYSPRFGLDIPVDEDVAAAVDGAVDQLIAAGCKVTREDPDWPKEASETALMPLQHAGLAAIYGEAFSRDSSVFDPDIAAQIGRGLGLSGAEVAAAQILSSKIAVALADFFMEVDLLVGPTTPCVAWPLDRLGPKTIGGEEVTPRVHAAFTPLFNHAKVPALSLPCGSGRAGLPVGLQLIGRRGRDRQLLEFARQAEAVLVDEYKGASTAHRGPPWEQSLCLSSP